MLLSKRAPIAPNNPSYKIASNVARPFREAWTGNSALLVLGDSVEFPGLIWHNDPTLRCTGVLLTGNVSGSELTAALEIMPDPASPIADFTGRYEMLADFSAQRLDPHTLAAAQQRFATVQESLSEIPFHAPREERTEMRILRVAYSRGNTIVARFAPACAEAVQYALLDNTKSKRIDLEGLAFRDLLRRRHFIRTHGCDVCASNRLLAFEACHACGSSDLVDEAIVHHYRCGCQEPESNFVQANGLACPKCHRALKHFGMDYGKPGLLVHCRNCGSSSPEPEPRFACMECSTTMDGQRAASTDWFHYDLTDAGIAALQAGRLPARPGRVAAGSASEHPSLREFHLLAIAALRSAQKYARPFTLAQFTLTNFASLCDQHGSGSVNQAVQQAGAAIGRDLSDNGVVGISHRSILLALPDIDISQANQIAKAQAARIAPTNLPLEFKITLSEGAEAAELLSRI